MSRIPDLYLLNNSLLLAALLFGLGVLGVIGRRNIGSVMLSTGILFQGVAMAFAAMGQVHGKAAGEAPALIVLIVGMIPVALLCAFAIRLARTEETSDASRASRLTEDGWQSGTESRSDAAVISQSPLAALASEPEALAEPHARDPDSTAGFQTSTPVGASGRGVEIDGTPQEARDGQQS